MTVRDWVTRRRATKPSATRDAARSRVASGDEVSWAAIRRSWRAYALLAPIFLVLIVFVYYPPLLGLVRAFYKWAPLKEPVFVGLENFRTYFGFAEFGREVTNVAKFLIAGIVKGVVVPFVMAELIFAVRSNVGKELYRLLIVVPMLIPTIVYTLLWERVYDPNLGPINAFLEAVGLDMLKRNWLGDPATALYAIIGVGFPWVATIGTLIYLGGLAQISESVFDSCLLDGCTGWRRALLIDVPLVLGQVRLLMVLAVLNSLQSINAILVLTHGGPGYATSVPGLRMFERAFGTGEFGYASAIGALVFISAMALTVVINQSLRPYTEIGR